MQHTPKKITDLSSEEALEFLMQTDQYHNFELPEYFNFTTILEYVKNKIGDMPYVDCISSIKAKDLSSVNIDILLNKDGKYAVRPIVLCNPFLYYFLSREICGRRNWSKIKSNFEKCRVPHITSCALPVIPEKQEKFHKCSTILNWWNSMEQRSIELSLEYRYMFVTDITNCYGSVNPQSIEWALARKNTSLPTNENQDIAESIILFLSEFQQGRNIGIPQGSTLFDLTGEIILCYSDLLLYEELTKVGIKDGYEILRYRDDYKVFCNNKDTLEKISYTLQQVLETLNFRMNSSKTFITDSIITDSIKPDKLFYISNTPIFNKKGCDFDGFQKHLLYILLFSRKFPNSGQLRTMLSDLDKRIANHISPQNADIEWDENKPSHRVGKIFENIKALCAVATQIAVENVSVTHYALRVISRLVNSMEENRREEKAEIISLVCDKLIMQPNSTYSKLWLQNMTYNQDIEKKASPYDFVLCKLVMGESVELWNNSWLKDNLAENLPIESIIDKKVLSKVTPVITFRETRKYSELVDIEFL